MAAFYTLSECAHLLREPKQTVREWTLKGLAPTRRVGQRRSPPAYTFADFISLYVVSELRRRGIRLQTIRAAEFWLRRQYEYERPLASARIFSAGKDILVRLGSDAVPGQTCSELDELSDVASTALVAANRGGQQAIEEAFGAVLQAVDYHDDIAIRWKPWLDVEVSPQRQFGAPCVAGTGIQTATLYSFVCAGDDAERVAKLYELPPERVQRALAWEKSLAPAA
jgi:uncharacterized protein (DUF433 family)